jgi:D-serine deaminase-like pyridoxal phosphate-dependent protein
VGSKGLAAEAGSPVALVLDHVVGENALEALTPSEEHLPCQWAGGEPSDAQVASLQRGDHVWLFPRHICPTVNMYDEAVLVDGSCATVPVDARGH